MVSYESIVLRIIGVDELSDPLGKGKKGFDDLGDSADKSSKKATKGMQDVGKSVDDAGGKIDQTTGKFELMGTKGALALAGVGAALLGLSAMFITEAMKMEHQWDAFASALGMTNLEFKEVKEEYSKDLDEMSQQTLRTKGTIRDNMVPLMAIGGTYEDSLAAQKYISGMAALRGTSGNDKADFQKAEGEYEMMIRGRNPALVLKKYGMEWKDLGVADKKEWEALTVPERMERVNKALSENNQVMKANENRMDSVTAKYDYLIGRTQGLMGTLGEDMLPMVNKILEGIIWIVEGFINQPEWVHQIVGWGILLGGFLAIAIAGIALLNVGLKQTLDAVGSGRGVYGKIASWFDDKKGGKPSMPDDSPIDKLKKDVDGKKVKAGIDLEPDCKSLRQAVQRCLDRDTFTISCECDDSDDDSSSSSSKKKKKKKKKKGKGSGVDAGDVTDVAGDQSDAVTNLSNTVGDLGWTSLLDPYLLVPLVGAFIGSELLQGRDAMSLFGRKPAWEGKPDKYPNAPQGGSWWDSIMYGLSGKADQDIAASQGKKMPGLLSPAAAARPNANAEKQRSEDIKDFFDMSRFGIKMPSTKPVTQWWNSVTGAFARAPGEIDKSLHDLYNRIAGWVGSSTDELKKLWCSVVGCSPGIIPAFKKMANEVPGHIDKVHPHIQRLNSSLNGTKGIGFGTSGSTKHVHQHGAVTIDARHMNAEQLKGLMTELFEGTINSRAAPKVDTSAKGTPMSKTSQVTP